MTGRRIAIAMSGGVDSSTAALVLKEAGWDPIGFSMQLWDQSRGISDPKLNQSVTCCSLDDFQEARAVAAKLQIPYYVVDFQAEFEKTIVRPFIEEYLEGCTPSPCVLCNSRMKFDRLLQMAERVGASYVATGHYARVESDPRTGRHLLLRAKDRGKDQAYFLFELQQFQLEKAVFPLGEMTKDQVRDLARCHGLSVADKSESQEICFIPDGDYAAFIERHYDEIVEQNGESEPFLPGPIVDTDGRVLGAHSGVHHFTVGQRRGLGIAHSSPLYVLKIDPEASRIVVGERSQLDKKRCRVVKPNWISIPDLTDPIHVEAKIRSRHPEAAAVISPMTDGSVDVLFEEPQPAVCPGQACVFYQGDVVVGGGWIARDGSNVE